jgi:TorA maturation chaperone TorD
VNSPFLSCSPAPLLLAELARLRQATYRLLGALFLYPDEARLAALAEAARALQNQGEFLAAFPFWGPWQRLLTALTSADPSTALRLRSGQGSGRRRQLPTVAVQQEYARLFLTNTGGVLCLPYESCYLDPNRQAAGWGPLPPPLPRLSSRNAFCGGRAGEGGSRNWSASTRLPA